MDMQQLVYICTVAECQSITKAANSLYISQPALSHFISKVEDQLGVKLFDRSTSPLSLTFAGERYIEYARQILMMENNMSKELGDISKNRKGRIRVGFPFERCSYMLPLILPRYRKKFPGIDVQIFSSKGDILMDRILKGQLDFAILPFQNNDNDGKDKNLEAKLIYSEELFLVTAKNVVGPEYYVDNCPYAVDLNKMKDLPFIFLKKGHALRTFLDLLFGSYKIKPNIFMEIDSNTCACRLASANMGVTIVPAMTIELAKCETEVDIYSLTKHPVRWEILALYRKDAYLSEAEKSFFEIAGEVFSKRSFIQHYRADNRPDSGTGRPG
ncbi:LysR family transcriptional regulator [Caproiciproducens sp. NJN-50]|uniref:LysR family transcriptional regulator n=1 Tax=Acutalibacteraceae TaxID=3082771 RepID=UPI000FFE0551|nr:MULTISPECIES: LysR family transcriptional regulator [Acutalibacteraceae]QAT49250.1 LysR family transcriptional regulator [Caproiciproducens sp. NJN-50]